MKNWLIAIILLAFIADAGIAADNFNWWGMISYRQRHEIYKTFIDITAADSTTWGDLRQTDDNSRTRLGYKFGFKVDVNDQISVAVTLRSGIGSVMWQDVNNENSGGLSPGLLEAYINWHSPYGKLLLGRIPQQGNAMWDLYAATNELRDPVRQDNPTDGIFNDKMGYLNGLKLLVPVGPLELRGTYHTDYVSGFRREYAGSSSEPERSPQMDQKIYLAGFKLDIGKVMSLSRVDIPEGLQMEINGDYGWPYRIGKGGGTFLGSSNRDSVYVDEKMYGATLNTGYYSDERKSGAELWISYSYDWREDFYKTTFRDYKASITFIGYRLTGRYQHNIHNIEVRPYIGEQAVRTAFHIYLNKTLWGLDIQPRYIQFKTEIGGNETISRDRYEITTTVTF